MRFVVIEGLDGSGKSTQIKLLRNYLETNGIKYQYLHFPRTDDSIYGELIARFLRGEFGDLDQVDPYLVALIYAGDRNDAKGMINSWIQDGYFVLLDRYVNSNIAFQCAKISRADEKAKLRDWILKLEFDYHKLPVPDINIFLDVPFDFTEKQLSGERQGGDRDYLNGANDIHEKSLDFQKEVRNIYLSLKDTPNYRVLDCFDEHRNMLEPAQIFTKIVNTLFENEKL